MTTNQPTVETIERTSWDGRSYKSTVVTLPNGQVRDFCKVLPRTEAIRQAVIDLGQRYEVVGTDIFC